MNIISAAIQGIVQGLTEFLPISSSGHLLLTQHILGQQQDNLFFNVMLHVGTLISVMLVYYKTIFDLIIAFFSLIKDVFTGKFNFSKLDGNKRMVLMLIISLVPLFLVFLPLPEPTKNIKGFAEILSNDKNIILVGICLIITSFLLTLGVKVSREKSSKHLLKLKKNNIMVSHEKKEYNIIDAIYVGITQFISVIFPGISRSGSTLSVSLMRGINRQKAIDFSFILGIPAVIAASLLEIKEVFESDSAMATIDISGIIVGILFSAVVGFLSIKLFKWILFKDRTDIFIIYTLAVGILSVTIGIIEICKGTNILMI
ncbi:MAG: undecaprenyl-diphosphate phosphatase [Oscillospiraceae bacterium]|jgi:undecaprenyl-diphosphatase|nr:undecaprenyl-diphosphate phosphatase [Oscillospiraceae bacterium]